MKKNFVLDGAVEVIVDDCLYDLHNSYDFIKLEMDIESKVVVLLFSEADSNRWGRESSSNTLSIKFQGVDYFELSPNFVKNLTVDLDEIGYKSPVDRNVNWLIGENKSSADDHIIFRFTNDEFVRIHAEGVYISHD